LESGASASTLAEVTRRLILLSAIAVLGKAPAAAAPNILLIFADDIGYEALGCYGGLDFETPRLDAMAKGGVRFSRAYTSPVCTPSRVSLHTGLYVTRHGHTGVLPVHLGTKKKVDFHAMPTFAQQLRSNGYLTSTTGKWQLATVEEHPDHIRDAGFDSWCVWQIWKDGAKTGRHWSPIYNEDGEERDDIAGRYGPDVLTDYVIEQMGEAKEAGKPFLIVHNELLPHWPIVESPDDRALGRKPSLANTIAYMDKLVGRLLDAVVDLGIRGETYVLFMGDNGTWPQDFENQKAGQPGEGKHTRHTELGRVEGGKRDLNDAGSHVPLIAWGPASVAAGEVCDDLVDIVDLFPTFCELSGTGIPASIAIDGRSIAPQIHGAAGIPRPWVHHAVGDDEALFDGEFRFLRKSGRLIDARRLPAEMAADPADPEAAAARKRLDAVFEQITRRGARPPLPFPPACASGP
jgi:arylsulfatase A-like enzyme